MRNNRNGILLQPIDKSLLKSRSVDSLVSADETISAFGGGAGSTLKPLSLASENDHRDNKGKQKKSKESGVPENRVFSFRYRNTWNATPRLK